MAPTTLQAWVHAVPEVVAAQVAPLRRAVAVDLHGWERWTLVHVPQARSNRALLSHAASRALIIMLARLFAHGIETVLLPLAPPEVELLGFTAPALRGFCAREGVRLRLGGGWRLDRGPTVAPLALLAAQLEAALPEGARRLILDVNPDGVLPALLAAAHRTGAAAHGLLYPDGPAQIHLLLGPRLNAAALPSPLLASQADMYALDHPALDLTGAQLRAILFDHLYSRPAPPPSAPDLAALGRWFTDYAGHVTGLGGRRPDGEWSVAGGIDAEAL